MVDTSFLKGPIFVPQGAELLGLIRQYEVSRLVEYSSRLDKSVRHRVKQESQLFFRHYGRLKWLIEKHGFVPTPDLMWGAFVVLLNGADAMQAAKVEELFFFFFFFSFFAGSAFKH